MIKTLKRVATRKGVPNYKLSKWIHRTQGVMVITRNRRCGDQGISLPCVLCRKALEKYKIHWSAMTNYGRVNSERSDDLPKSVPTGKQKRHYKFLG